MMKLFRIIIIAAFLGQASCFNYGYVKNHPPVESALGTGRNEYVYEVKSKRGAVTFIQNDLADTAGNPYGSYDIIIKNKGVEFMVAMNDVKVTESKWIIVHRDETKHIRVGRSGTGFQASNQLGASTVSYREPIVATIIFKGIRKVSDRSPLIESYGEAL